MNKRGQISVFIVVAIVIVAGLLIYFSLREGPTVSVNPEIAPVFNFVQNCVEKSTLDAVYHIGQYGGYYVIPEKVTTSKIPIYVDNGKNLLPSKIQIEKELSDYIENRLFFCTRNFVDFPTFEIDSSEVESLVTIENDKIKFDVRYPLRVSTDGKVYEISNFEYEVESRLSEIYEIVDYIIGDKLENSKSLCVTCLYQLAQEKEIVVLINKDPFDKKILIFTLIDGKDRQEGEEYVYYFAVRGENG